MARKSNTFQSVNDFNLHYLLQNYNKNQKKNTKNSKTENYLVAPKFLQNKNSPKYPNMNTMVEYLFSNFARQHEQAKQNEQTKQRKRMKLLKESKAVITNRLMKESDVAFKLLGMPGYRNAKFRNRTQNYLY
jgi:hypothetical protein